MASPVFRQKPTFLLRKWISEDHAAGAEPSASKSKGGFAW